MTSRIPEDGISAGRNDGDVEGLRPPRLLVALTVCVAALGLLSLTLVLLTALARGSVWPPAMVGAYVCLPAAFLLMIVQIVSAVRARGRL